MGAVYRATDTKFGTAVAIKETFYGDTELTEAFEREARLLNGLHHPILPHVSDYFIENGGHFLVMEYIEGEDLSELLRRGEVFSVESVLDWTLELLDGLDYLHSQEPPVIHRDIKPNNLKITPRGNIVLLDFGMAKETVANTAAAKSIFGYSKKYSPLEQIEGTGTDERSDIFSLGASVYHLLTGKAPVDVLARASAIISGRPDPIVSANIMRSDVPEDVSRILNAALDLTPDKRFESARAMSNAVQHVRRNLSSSEEVIVPAVIAGSTFAAAMPSEEITPEQDLGVAWANDDTTPIVEPISPVPDIESEVAGAGSSSSNAVPWKTQGARDRMSPRLRGPLAQLRGLQRTRPGLVFMIPILLLFLALVLFGSYRRYQSRDAAPASAVNAPEASGQTEVPVETSQQEEPIITAEQQVSVEESEPLNLLSQPEPVDESEVEESEGDESEVGEESEPSTRQSVRPSRRTTAAPLAREAQKTRNEPAAARAEDKRPAVGSTRAKTQERRVTAGNTRPRGVQPAFEQPSVSSIEAIMTGVPYERRRRWTVDDEIWLEEDRRRRRMRRAVRNNRYPF